MAFFDLKSNRSIWILALYLFITIPLTFYQNIWIDEIYSLVTTSKDFSYTIHQSLHFEGHPPLYFLLLKAWRLISPSIIFTRYLSVLFTLVSILMAFKLSKKYLPNINPYWFMLIFTINPFVLWIGIEIRPYALILMLSCILLYFYYEAYLTNSENTSKHQVWFLIFSVFAVYSQYFAGFLLFSLAVPLLLQKKWNILKIYVLHMILPVTALLLLAPYVPGQIRMHTYKLTLNEPLIDYFIFIASRIKGFVLSMQSFGFNTIGRHILNIFIVLFFIISSYSIYKKKAFTKILRHPAFHLVMVLSAIFATLFSFLGFDLLALRHMVVLFVPALILFFTVLSIFPKQRLIIIALVFLCGMYLFSSYQVFIVNRRSEVFEKAANIISQNEKPHQPILVYPNEQALVLSYFYKGENRIIPIPQPIDFSKPFLDDSWFLKDQNHLDSLITKLPPETHSAWVLTYLKHSVNGYDFHPEQVLQYFEKSPSKKELKMLSNGMELDFVHLK